MLDKNAYTDVLSAALEETSTPTISFGEKLDSDAFNTTCADIAAALDTLYAKTRYLEDIRNYVKAYIEKRIDEETKKVADRLKIVEHAVDDFESTDYVAYNVPFSGKIETIYDRDGSILHSMDSVNGHLEVSSKTLYDGQIVKVDAGELQVEAELRSENFDNLKEGRPARCIYYTYKPVKDGIDKEITLTLKNPIKVNYIGVHTANCDLTKKEVILQNGNHVSVGLSTNYLSETEIQGIVLTLHATNYDYTKRHSNSQRSTSDKVWKTQIANN